ncbi:P27 family phage terminase small subunit [Nocardia sp. NPDC051052]|uniref:P27 family phage terminase small subunit n=1 Tax=Nocardia sp. NPDC051052 TaxID=3364322 RepID=UPI0037AE3D39
MNLPADYPVIPLHRPPAAGPDHDAVDAAPEPPEWMTSNGRDAWQRLTLHVQVTATNRDEFAAYCEAIAEFRESTEIISETGLLILDPASGQPAPNPVTMVRDRADAKIARWAQRFRGQQ